MEENKLFNDFYSIKYEIEKDLSILNSLQCDLKLKNLYEKNKELSETICLMKREYDMKLDQVVREGLISEKEFARMDNSIVEKENQIKMLKEKLRDLEEENKVINFKFLEVKSM